MPPRLEIRTMFFILPPLGERLTANWYDSFAIPLGSEVLAKAIVGCDFLVRGQRVQYLLREMYLGLIRQDLDITTKWNFRRQMTESYGSRRVEELPFAPDDYTIDLLTKLWLAQAWELEAEQRQGLRTFFPD